MRNARTSAVIFTLGAGLLSSTAYALDAETSLTFPAQQDATPAIVAAANAFLDMLDETERVAVLFDFDDAAQKVNWTNFPEGGSDSPRAGVRWGNMTDEERAALMTLLGELLSADGLRMVQEQMAADDVIAANDTGAPPAGAMPPADDAAARPASNATDSTAENSGPPSGGRPAVNFGSDYYFVSIMGTPSTTDPWRIQFGGHHLAINATIVGADVTFSPTLTGGEPLKFSLDGQPIYIVEEEAVQAAALLANLTDEQRTAAVVSEERVDLVLGPGQDGKTLQPEGISGADLDNVQKVQFLELIEARLGIMNADDLATTMQPIVDNLDETYFAWFGPTEPLGAAYWRVVGPTVILEFSPQVNDGDPTDHAHNMYRDPTNEYGAAWTTVD